MSKRATSKPKKLSPAQEKRNARARALGYDNDYHRRLVEGAASKPGATIQQLRGHGKGDRGKVATKPTRSKRLNVNAIPERTVKHGPRAQTREVWEYDLTPFYESEERLHKALRVIRWKAEEFNEKRRKRYVLVRFFYHSERYADDDEGSFASSSYGTYHGRNEEKRWSDFMLLFDDARNDAIEGIVNVVQLGYTSIGKLLS